MPRRTWDLLPLAAMLLVPAGALAQPDRPLPKKDPKLGIEVVAVPSPGSPLVALRILFRVGSIYDPPGKEGLAALTALMLGDAGTARRSYADRLDALYPLAGSIEVRTERETSFFAGEVHRDKLEEYTALLTEGIVEPGFAEADFRRNREKLLSYLNTTLRSSSDELLGLEALQEAVFTNGPYAHPPQGTVEGLKNITLDDVRKFYHRHYTWQTLIPGVAGGYPPEYIPRLQERLGALPNFKHPMRRVPPPAVPAGRQFTLIEKQTASVGTHCGYPARIGWQEADYYPLLVANSFLGEHRTAHGRLMQELREKRGLNYGDYSYIDYYDDPPGTTLPSPGFPRRLGYVSLWLRPVAPRNARFALRAALSQVDSLIAKGLTQEEFEETRAFLLNYSKLWAQSLPRRLGFLVDSRFYGTPSLLDLLAENLRTMKLADVQRAIGTHLQTKNLRIVVVTADAAKLKAEIEGDGPSPIVYASKVPAEVKKADQQIQTLPLKPAHIEIVPVAQMFERGPAGAPPCEDCDLTP